MPLSITYTLEFGLLHVPESSKDLVLRDQLSRNQLPRDQFSQINFSQNQFPYDQPQLKL